MLNIVSLDMERPRPPRAFPVPRSGARILFFTGVRYCREEMMGPTAADTGCSGAATASASERVLDEAAH